MIGETRKLLIPGEGYDKGYEEIVALRASWCVFRACVKGRFAKKTHSKAFVRGPD